MTIINNVRNDYTFTLIRSYFLQGSRSGSRQSCGVWWAPATDTEERDLLQDGGRGRDTPEHRVVNEIWEIVVTQYIIRDQNVPCTGTVFFYLLPSLVHNKSINTGTIHSIPVGLNTFLLCSICTIFIIPLQFLCWSVSMAFNSVIRAAFKVKPWWWWTLVVLGLQNRPVELQLTIKPRDPNGTSRGRS